MGPTLFMTLCRILLSLEAVNTLSSKFLLLKPKIYSKKRASLGAVSGQSNCKGIQDVFILIHEERLL